METDAINNRAVVVIGGGLAGLTTACYLARAGVSVTLFERSAQLGGRAATQVHEGYYFNRGVHALYTGGATSEILNELGISYTYGIPKDLFMLQQNKLYITPFTPGKLLRTSLLNIGDKFELLRFLSSLPKLSAPQLAHVSIQEWLEQTMRRPQVRTLLTAWARTFVYSNALHLVSAEVFIDKLQRSLKHPIHYIDGGWQTLVDALAEKAEQAGVHIMRGIGVESVCSQEGKASGVLLRDGTQLPASAVVIATAPHDAPRLFEHNGYKTIRQLVEGLVPAQIACLDVALSSLPNPRYPIVHDMERPLFLTTQSRYARIAPQGGALVSTFKQLDPDHPSDPYEDKRELEELLDRAQPGWRTVLIKDSYLPRIEAVGHLPTAATGGFAGRPATLVPGLSNLYLVGDWIGPQGFLCDASTASARQAAHALLEKVAP